MRKNNQLTTTLTPISLRHTRYQSAGNYHVTYTTTIYVEKDNCTKFCTLLPFNYNINPPLSIGNRNRKQEPENHQPISTLGESEIKTLHGSQAKALKSNRNYARNEQGKIYR